MRTQIIFVPQKSGNGVECEDDAMIANKQTNEGNKTNLFYFQARINAGNVIKLLSKQNTGIVWF